ncbi:hypothetical protein CSKR_109810 [Clonorchis sinensis]|uniref:Granulins domain-containing protein n=1 Tax=Clonorchis sinensis TaxID=79923 RepID=A0A8T1LXW6_CLOSI|nr:hypothetical protein CSKR_109810 [Clonorchis sinensis]
MMRPDLPILLVLLLTVGVISGDPSCGLHCTESCCETSKGDFQCCPFVNGVCCTDGRSCCPQGSTCDPDGLSCSFQTGARVSRKNLRKKDDDFGQLHLNTPGAGTPTLCPDKKYTCPDNSTCCSLSSDSWGCCDLPNAVCCTDGLHCCPHGTRCNAQKGECDPVEQVPLTNEVDQFLSLVFMSKLRTSRTESDRVDQHTSVNNIAQSPWNAVTGSWVQCADGLHECPNGTTCCLDQFDQYACCSFPRAVCCADKEHCCPEGYTCEAESGLCRSSSMSQRLQVTTEKAKSKDLIPNDEQLCPDGHSRCPYTHTCCQLADRTWGCCPLSEAVCCPDGLHCCPSGYKCNMEKETCVKNVVDTPLLQPSSLPARSATKITCDNPEFQCDNGTTCCPLPNDEWACCSFANAVCCSDQAHCCPGNTTCDLEHSRCVPKPTENRPLATDNLMMRIAQRMDLKAGETCQMFCPTGICCTDSFGITACCPIPYAVCCPNSTQCCPWGMRCDGRTMMCLPTGTTNGLPESIPWSVKTPARQQASTTDKPTVSKANVALPPRNITCPDRRHVCKYNQTCCLHKTGDYACCPFANATCCSDRLHCCPANTTCGWFGTCVRKLNLQSKQDVSDAHRMQPTTGQSSLPPAVTNLNFQLGKAANAEWCGDLCPSSGFCCADKSGQPRRKCCPATAGVCCSDGEYCCPRGSRCMGNGKCLSESPNVQTSSAPYLIPAMGTNSVSAGFPQGFEPQPSHIHSFALKTTAARINPMFLLDFYYRRNARKFTVCPDLERTCGLDQQCCPSLKHHYTCAPKGVTCCPHTSDTYCPSGGVCSQDGLLCGPPE